MRAFKAVSRRSQNWKRVSERLIPTIKRDELAMTMHGWCKCLEKRRQTRHILLNLKARRQRRLTRAVLDYLTSLAAAARTHACQSRCAAAVLRSTARQMCYHRLRGGVEALERNARSMKHVKTLLLLSSPRPALLHSPAHVNVRNPGRFRNHAYRVLESSFTHWDAVRNSQASLREATRRVLISRRKNDLEIDAAFNAAVNSLKHDLTLSRTLSVWRHLSTRSLWERARSGFVTRDCRQVARGLMELADAVGCSLLSVLDCYKLTKCESVDGIVRELEAARLRALAHPPPLLSQLPTSQLPANSAQLPTSQLPANSKGTRLDFAQANSADASASTDAFVLEARGTGL